MKTKIFYISKKIINYIAISNQKTLYLAFEWTLSIKGIIFRFPKRFSCAVLVLMGQGALLSIHWITTQCSHTLLNQLKSCPKIKTIQSIYIWVHVRKKKTKKSVKMFCKITCEKEQFVSFVVWVVEKSFTLYFANGYTVCLKKRNSRKNVWKKKENGGCGTKVQN